MKTRKSLASLLFFLLTLFVVFQKSQATFFGDCENTGEMAFFDNTLRFKTLKTSGRIVARNTDLIIDKSLTIVGESGEFKFYVSDKKDENAKSIIHLGKSLYLNICIPEKSEIPGTQYRSYDYLNETGAVVFVYNFSPEDDLTREDLVSIIIESEKACLMHYRDTDVAEMIFWDNTVGIVGPNKVAIVDKPAKKLFDTHFSLFGDSKIYVAGIELSFQ
ncbi:hypothetical protein ACFLYU_05775 [Candidatus Dependentiae bacterium]